MKVKGVKLLNLFQIRAIVLYPFIFFADKKPDDFILNHERIHWEQLKRDGVVAFYRQYLWEYYLGRRKGLSHDEAYRSIGYEVEAYREQNNLAYQVRSAGKLS